MAETRATITLDGEDVIEAKSLNRYHWIKLGPNDLFLGHPGQEEAIAENALRLIEAAQAVREKALRWLAGPPDPIDEAKRAREIAESAPGDLPSPEFTSVDRPYPENPWNPTHHG